MKTRFFNAACTDVSLLGFGAMRFPVMADDPGTVDEKESIRLLRYAIDHGVNYIDTAYVYGNSEVIVGKALKDGYREKTLLATKMPFFMMKGPEAMEPLFNEQLERLGVDQIDMYLVHDVRGDRMAKIKDWKIFEFLENKRKAGKIRFIGFSFHGESPEVFKELLDAYPWDFCQLQINYMDKDLQAGIAGYEYAVSKDVPIVVMEPLKGGRLTDSMPPSIQKYWDDLGSGRSPAEWALRWVANLPGVLTILSGMSTMAQLEDNIRILSAADAGELSEHELSVIDNVAAAYNKLIAYGCTACRYCMPCAAKIDIPGIMEYRNAIDVYGKTDRMQSEYKKFVHPKASACIECGKCEGECPQHLGIIRAMKETAQALG